MSKQDIYDVYKRPNGFLYRVPLFSPLHALAEFYAEETRLWLPSSHTVGGVVMLSCSTLVARNVVFKDSACSQ
jgi:hypothetical protein|nr:MAG TPA: GABARAP domain of GABA-receptor-associated protein [Caudoviricetes sp.]